MVRHEKADQNSPWAACHLPHPKATSTFPKYGVQEKKELAPNLGLTTMEAIVCFYFQFSYSLLTSPF